MNDLQAPVDSKILADLQALVEQQAAIIKAQALHIEKLTFELATLKRRLFGRSSEAADTLTVQGQLFALPETVEIKPAAAHASDARKRQAAAQARAFAAGFATRGTRH